MSMVAGPTYACRRVGRRWWHSALCVGVPVLIVVVVALGMTRDVPRWPFVVAAVALTFAMVRALVPWVRWRHVGLRLDDEGITVGALDRDGRPVAASPRLDARAGCYQVPWTAVYDARVVTGSAAVREMSGLSWVRRPAGGAATATTSGSGAILARPPYFVGAAPVLTFRVDLRQARMTAIPGDRVPSHVWAVPVPGQDVDTVMQLMAAHGVPVVTTDDAVYPTPSSGMSG